MIDVYCKLREYPEDHGEYRTVQVSSHWSDQSMVMIEVLGNPEPVPPIRVVGADLITAVENAMRSGRR